MRTKRPRSTATRLARAFVAVATLVTAASLVRSADAGVAVNAYVYFDLVIRHSSKCLSAPGGTQGDSVVQWECLGSTGQQWRRTNTTDGYFLLVNAGSGKCLDIEDASQADGAYAHLWVCHGKFNQQFLQAAVGDGYFALKARHSGRCLQVEGGSYGDNALILQGGCSRADIRDHWKMS